MLTREATTDLCNLTADTAEHFCCYGDRPAALILVRDGGRLRPVTFLDDAGEEMAGATEECAEHLIDAARRLVEAAPSLFYEPGLVGEFTYDFLPTYRIPTDHPNYREAG